MRKEAGLIAGPNQGSRAAGSTLTVAAPSRLFVSHRGAQGDLRLAQLAPTTGRVQSTRTVGNTSGGRDLDALAAERVDFLYGEALEHFRQQGAKGNKGPQYLLAAGRMAALGARLPVSQLDSLLAFNEASDALYASEVNSGDYPPR